jgi:anti-sigma regulatory factor (Ser/Thr protein kinase)
MTASLTHDTLGTTAVFRHEALFYAGEDGFLSGVLPFLAQGAENDEPSLVVVSAPRISMLRDALGRHARKICFADMADVGRNPARIIPAWRRFLDDHAGDERPLRGVGEPIWAARSAAALVECQRHEALLNVAFAGSRSWALMCPYDTDALPAAVLDEAQRSHPFLRDSGDGGDSGDSAVFRGEDMAAAHRDAPLPEPARCLESMEFTQGQLRVVRAVTAARGEQFGLDGDSVESFVLAVHEIAANSLTHGGGSGTYRLWREGRSLVCEVRDSGYIAEPLAGRVQPGDASQRGRGLWMANQLCDLVQVRSAQSGSVVRLHVSLDNR